MAKKTSKAIVGIVLIGGGLGYLVYNAMQSSWSYYISVDELATKKSLAQTSTIRITGIVAKDSISRDLKKKMLAFSLKGKDVSLPVSYSGAVPDNFAEDRQVVVEGRLDDDGVFQADKLITKCESKYRAKVTEQENTVVPD